jgi:tripartite-type tricarboxylate transporter receptor subunit TctC
MFVTNPSNCKGRRERALLPAPNSETTFREDCAKMTSLPRLPALRPALAIAALLGATMASVLAPTAAAQRADHAAVWPTRPIRILVGFSAGGGTDIAARLVAQPLQELLGQPVVVENRVGAGGMTAADAVAKSAKDGYTALMMSNAHAVSAVMYKTLRYDPVNDFAMVSMVATAGLVLVTRPDFPARDLEELVTYVRANPGKLNFGSAGVGTTQQFAGELMKQTAALDITHVPYRSTPAAVTGLRAKDVEYLFELVQPVQGQVQAGDLKAIAVTSPERNPILPDVPTFKESGMPDYDVTSWYGLAFAAETPPAIVQKANKALREILARESIEKPIRTMGALVRSSTPEELEAHIAAEIAKWKGVREKAGIAQEQ